MKLTKLLPLLAVALLAAACGKDGNGDGDKTPVVSLNNRPTTLKTGASATIYAMVENPSGTIPNGNVKLVWNDGADNTVTMSYLSSTGEYSGTFKPAKDGTVKYWVTATNSDGFTGSSQTITMTVSEDGGGDGEPVSKLRLSEIGTYEKGKFIELYNPTDDRVTLGDVSIFKNGELLHSFTSSNFLAAGGYGVLFAKDTDENTSGATGTFQKLGSITAGLSGSKSLSIELRYGGSTIDAFANTLNPDVEAAEWDDEVEREAYNFLRVDNGNGWYATKTSSTPGRANAEVADGVRLRHQYFKADALADVPYLRNIQINPGNTIPQGIKSGNNTITVEAYTDAFSELSAVSFSVNGSATNMTRIGESNVFTGTTSFSGSSATVVITAFNTGSSKLEFETKVLASTVSFVAQTNVVLNEINTQNGDYIEIYNTSSSPVSLSGMYFRKNKDKFFTIPPHMMLEGGKYGVLFCDNAEYTPPAGYTYVHLGSVKTGISGKKSLLVDLRDANKTDIDIFSNVYTNDRYASWDMEGDSYIEHNLGDLGKSAGRAPNGTGDWYVLESTTVGTANASRTSANLKFNNIVPALGGD